MRVLIIDTDTRRRFQRRSAVEERSDDEISVKSAFLMDIRKQKIIETIVREYVKNPKPVSSKILAQKLGLSSATLRNEMKELEKAGYLLKPHTSAGRVPTEKAYRLFIKSLGGKKVSVPVKISKKPSEDVFKDVTKTLADMSGGLAFSGIKELNTFFQSGLSNLFKEPEWDDKDYFSEMAKMMEGFEKHFNQLFKEVDEDETRIFIGKENPFMKAKKLTLIISGCRTPNQKHGIIGLLGPMRMRYDYNIALINRLRGLLEGME